MKKKLFRTRVGNTNLATALKEGKSFQEAFNFDKESLHQGVRKGREEASVKANLDSESGDREKFIVQVKKGAKREPDFRSLDVAHLQNLGSKSRDDGSLQQLEFQSKKKTDVLSKLSRDADTTRVNFSTTSERFREQPKERNFEKKRFRKRSAQKIGGKLEPIMNALEQLHSKLGSTDYFRLYLQKWGSATDSSAVTLPDFVRRLDLMGYTITEGQAKEFASYLAKPGETTSTHDSDPSKVQMIPLKDLSLIGSLVKNPTNKEKLSHGVQSAVVHERLAELEKTRLDKLEDKLFKAKFSKIKDQIVNSLRHEEQLNEQKVFKLLGYLGLNSQTVDEKTREKFIKEYLDAEGRFKTEEFYRDMHAHWPNKTRQVPNSNLAPPSKRRTPC